MVAKIGKLATEKQVGSSAFCLNSRHGSAGAASQESVTEQVKSAAGKIKVLAKSNLSSSQGVFSYERKKDYVPMRLNAVQHIAPNDSSLYSLLSLATVILRVGFMENPEMMRKILTRVVGT